MYVYMYVCMYVCLKLHETLSNNINFKSIGYSEINSLVKYDLFAYTTRYQMLDRYQIWQVA